MLHTCSLAHACLPACLPRRRTDEPAVTLTTHSLTQSLTHGWMDGCRLFACVRVCPACLPACLFHWQQGPIRLEQSRGQRSLAREVSGQSVMSLHVCVCVCDSVFHKKRVGPLFSLLAYTQTHHRTWQSNERTKGWMDNSNVRSIVGGSE